MSTGDVFLLGFSINSHFMFFLFMISNEKKKTLNKETGMEVSLYKCHSIDDVPKPKQNPENLTQWQNAFDDYHLYLTGS